MGEKKRCFVISPIGEEGSEARQHADAVYQYIIDPAMKECGFEAKRSDQIAQPGMISQEMFRRLLGDDLCIALLTPPNPNVFYELALAHAARRPVVLLIQKGQPVPFDIRDLRCVEYRLDPHDPRPLTGAADAARVVEHIRSLEESGWKAESPVDLSKYTGRARFYEAFGEDDLVLVLSPGDIDPVLRGTSVHTLLGALEFQEALNRQGYKLKRVRADSFDADSKRRNVISVGGPIPNRVTRYLFEQPEIIYSFGGADGHSIVKAGDPDFELNPPRVGDHVSRDYGILTRMKNPYKRDLDAIVACGCFGWGTQAALRILTDPDSLRFLTDFGRYFQVICTCSVDEDQVGTDPELLDLCSDERLRRSTVVSLYGGG